MAAPEPSVLCSHRPVLPELFGLLGVQRGAAVARPSWWSCHHREGAPGRASSATCSEPL